MAHRKISGATPLFTAASAVSRLRSLNRVVTAAKPDCPELTSSACVDVDCVEVEAKGVPIRADKLGAMKQTNLDLLNARRSVPSKLLGEPGPSSDQMEALVTAALRVPDHGRLEPWRLICIEGPARNRLGEALARIHGEHDPAVTDSTLEKDRQRFNHAPLVLIVVARITTPHKIPAIEQMLSAGCVAYNLLLGAQALGFGAQWLTGWAAYDADVEAALGLIASERIVGFIHIGTSREVVDERTRPDTVAHLTDWHGCSA